MPYRERSEQHKENISFREKKTNVLLYLNTVFCLANQSELGVCTNLALPK